MLRFKPSNSFNFTGQAPYRVFYNRNTTAQVINTNNSTFTITVPNSTSTETFTLTGISSGNCFTTATGSVVLTPLQTPQFAGSSGCAGPRTITVTGAPAGSSYNWYTSATATTPIAGVTTGTYNVPNLTTTTSYYVSIVDASGCESPRTTVTATVSSVPTGSVPPNRTVCSSDAPFTLTPAVPTGGTWSGPGVTPAGVFTPSYSMSGPQVLTYTFNPAGCPGTATTTVTVNPGPATPTINFVAPDTLMASVSASSYEWKLNGNVLPNTTQKLKVTASGLYTVKAIGSGNCSSQYSPDYNYVVSGLNEDLVKRINLYPNPTTGIIQVELNQYLASQITVINSLGQEVFTKTLSKSDQTVPVTLNLSGIAKGLYLVQVKTEKQVITNKIIIK